MEIRKNDEFELTIEDMSEDGAGIGKQDGYIWFVKDAVIGDRIRARAMKMKKNYGFARLMMPEYGMGFWQCKLRYWNQEQLLSVARKYKELGVPLDVIVVDFFHWTKQGEFKFDPKYWPDVPGMCRELKEMGIQVVVSVWPTVDIYSENFEEMKEKGYLVRTEHGVPLTMLCGGNEVFFDATNPDARTYVWEKIKKNYYDQGAKLFWLDVAEPEYSVYDFKNYRYQLGSVQEVGNIYPKYWW